MNLPDGWPKKIEVTGMEINPERSIGRNEGIEACEQALEAQAKHEIVGQGAMAVLNCVEAQAPSEEGIEAIAAEIHGVYCKQYEKNKGVPYWTFNDYSQLDEPTKDYDRALARWHLSKLAPGQRHMLDEQGVINVINEVTEREPKGLKLTLEYTQAICAKFSTQKADNQ